MIDTTLNLNHTKTSQLTTKAQYFFIYLIILITANCLAIITDWFLMGLFLLTFMIFALEKKKFDKIIIYILSAWLCINFISYIINQTTFSTWTFTGFIIKMLYPYFIVKIIGDTFFEKLEKIIFILTCISLPLFTIQILFPEFCHMFNSLFKNITSDEMITKNGWYGIIFRIDGSATDRNAGFMWEAGAFAFMLLLALIYRILRFGLIIDLKIAIYTIALITTFSTMAYIGLAILLIAYITSSKKVGILFFTIPLVFLYINFVKDMDFMLPKINNYILTLGQSYTPEGQYYLKVNRIAYIMFALEQSLHWPLGYGVVPSKYMYTDYNNTALEGVGTIAQLLIYWGWIGVAFFISAIYKYLKNLQLRTDHKLLISGVVILIIAFFSNPFEKSPMLYSIIFYPFLFKNKLLKKYV